jgi:hypothetical protein
LTVLDTSRIEPSSDSGGLSRCDDLASPWQSSAPCSGLGYIFVHIPKTAGSSLLRVLHEVAPGPILHLDTDRLRDVSVVEHFREHLLVAGHLPLFRIASAVQPFVRLFTVVREPVDRVLSHYFYYRHLPADLADPDVSQCHSYELPDLLALYDRPEVSPFSNLQTYYLSGERDLRASPERLLELAKERLASFTFVGLQEQLSESVDLLCASEGWPFPGDTPYENRTRSRARAEELPSSVRERIARMNAADIELYRYAKELYRQRKRALLRAASARIHGTPGAEAAAPRPAEVATVGELARAERLARRERGDGGMRILHAAVFSGVRADGAIFTGDPISIEIVLRTEIDHSNLTVGFVIADDVPTEVYGTNNECLGGEIRVERGGTYRVVYSFTASLAAGRYHLSVALHEGARVFHWIDNHLTFEVQATSRRRFAGIVDLRAAMAVDTCEEGAPLLPEECRSVRLHLASPDPALGRGTSVIDVVVENESDRTLASISPHPVHLSYHWLDARTGEVVVFDGVRSRLEPPLPPRSRGRYSVVVEAPPSEGVLVLRVTLGETKSRSALPRSEACASRGESSGRSMGQRTAMSGSFQTMVRSCSGA